LARDIGEAANFATYFTGSPAAEIHTAPVHLCVGNMVTGHRALSEVEKPILRIPVFTHTKGRMDVPLMTIMAGRCSRSCCVLEGWHADCVGLRDNYCADLGCVDGHVELNVLKGHIGWSTSVAISKDGMQIVSGSDDCTVRVWDASTGVELNVFKGHIGCSTRLRFRGTACGLYLVRVTRLCGCGMCRQMQS
jgi:hypothetical protein